MSKNINIQFLTALIFLLSPFTHSEVLENFEVIATLIAVSGPAQPVSDPDRTGGLFCRNNTDVIGQTESYGVTDFNFNADSNLVSFSFWEAIGSEIYRDDQKGHRIITFKTNVSFEREPYHSSETNQIEGYSQATEELGGSWKSMYTPSFTATFIERSRVWSLDPTVPIAACSKTWRLRGGTGNAGSSPEESIDLPTVRTFIDFVRSLIIDDSKSINVNEVRERQVICCGVRG